MLAIQTTPLPPLPPVLSAHMQEQVLLAITLMAFAVCAVFLFKPLVRAIARRIEGGRADPALAGEVEELRAQLAELEPLQHQVRELEERLEFTERVLAQRRDQDVLPRGGVS